MTARSPALASTFALFLAASGCGEPSHDICARVTMAHVNDLCGTHATATMSFDEPGADSGTDYDSRSCFYDGARGPDVSALRATFHGGASAAQARFQEDRGALAGNGTITDLSAPGDAAFYLEDLPTNAASIHVVEGDVYVTINDNVVSAQSAASTMQCLTALASEVLALR
jgi:hypothetical protein